MEIEHGPYGGLRVPRQTVIADGWRLWAYQQRLRAIATTTIEVGLQQSTLAGGAGMRRCWYSIRFDWRLDADVLPANAQRCDPVALVESAGR